MQAFWGSCFLFATGSKVYNIYKKQALKLAEGIDLPEDHLAFMCDFMAMLADRAVEARAASDMGKIERAILCLLVFYQVVQHLGGFHGGGSGYPR